MMPVQRIKDAFKATAPRERREDRRNEKAGINIHFYNKKMREQAQSKTKRPTKAAHIRPFNRNIIFPFAAERYYTHVTSKRQNAAKIAHFKNTFYTDVKTSARFKMILKSLMLHLTLPILALIFLVGVQIAYVMMTGDSIGFAEGPGNYLFAWFLIASFFAFRRVRDGQAYFDARIVANKHSLNTFTLDKFHTSPHIKHDDELKFMERYRKRYNKYILFPSQVERNIFPQMDSTPRFRSHQADVNYYKENCTITQLQREHRAAKQIADIKQELNGGSNEYDDMVKKFASRMDPTLKQALNL